jgi:N-acetylglucosaminyldiphosphoundecaprenol N-acetyl-beta-D-mannosaminyltransferase
MDLFIAICRQLDREGGRRVFFLGSSEETLAVIRARMAVEFPRVVVATHAPPFAEKFSQRENQLMLGAIHSARPDVLFVGMTAPKQEKWIREHRDVLGVPVAGAIGAVFDFYSGRVRRPPVVFQRLGLEWLPRLLQEPRRLWRRNFVSSPLFLRDVFAEARGRCRNWLR